MFWTRSSVVERFVDIEEVRSSILLESTIFTEVLSFDYAQAVRGSEEPSGPELRVEGLAEPYLQRSRTI